jgi:hypothetical protein
MGAQETDGLLCMEMIEHEVMEDTEINKSYQLVRLHTDALFQ